MRLLDALAFASRQRGHELGLGATDRGGFLDIAADFTVYGGFVLGVAIAVLVAITAVQHVIFAARSLAEPPATPRA